MHQTTHRLACKMHELAGNNGTRQNHVATDIQTTQRCRVPFYSHLMVVPYLKTMEFLCLKRGLDLVGLTANTNVQKTVINGHSCGPPPACTIVCTIVC